MSPRYEVELSWCAFGTYEVEAADEDAAVIAAIKQAQADGAETETCELEAVSEADDV